MKYYELAERYPPPLVRLLAREGGKAMTTEYIAERCAWHPDVVERIANTPTWEQVPLWQIRMFTRACNLDFTNSDDLNRAEVYLRMNDVNPKWTYLLESPHWKTVFQPLIVRWRKTMTKPNDKLPSAICRLLKGFKV
jgi:hypothetical protein